MSPIFVMTLLMLLIILFISLPLKIEISFIICPSFILGQILTAAVNFLLGSISFRRQLLIATYNECSPIF